MSKFKVGDKVIFINKNNTLFNSEGIILGLEEDFIYDKGTFILKSQAIVDFYYFSEAQRVCTSNLVLKKLKIFL